MERASFTGGRKKEGGLFEEEFNTLNTSGRNSEVIIPKKKSRKKKFKNFIKRICCMGPTRTNDPMIKQQTKPESFWKHVLDN